MDSADVLRRVCTGVHQPERRPVTLHGQRRRWRGTVHSGVAASAGIDRVLCDTSCLPQRVPNLCRQ